MTRSLLFLFALWIPCLTGSAAFANAMFVVGEGPERACYQAARTGLDSIAGIGHCNLALQNPLVINDRVATLVNRGVILHKLSRVQPALNDFNAALRILPDQADAHINRGVALLSLKRFDEALADIERGIVLGPSDPALAFFNRAIAHERMGKIPEAYYDYQRALKEAPDFTAAANALSRFVVRPKT